MMNYIKSELYRVLHEKGIKIFIMVLTVLSLLLNTVLYICGMTEGESFRYATTSFSYSNLVALPMVFGAMATVIGLILYDGNKKNGNLKNTIAFGISRIRIFAGQCVTALITAVVAMTIVLTVYILSAELLLEHTGAVRLSDLLTEVPAVFLIAAACLISGIVCMEVPVKSSTGTIVWLLVWFVIPEIFYYAGIEFDSLRRISMWMPKNFFGSAGMLVNQSNSVTAWGTAEGMAKCVTAGIAGVIIFSFAGVALLRRKDL